MFVYIEILILTIIYNSNRDKHTVRLTTKADELSKKNGCIESVTVVRISLCLNISPLRKFSGLHLNRG